MSYSWAQLDYDDSKVLLELRVLEIFVMQLEDELSTLKPVFEHSKIQSIVRSPHHGDVINIALLSTNFIHLAEVKMSIHA